MALTMKPHYKKDGRVGGYRFSGSQAEAESQLTTLTPALGALASTTGPALPPETVYNALASLALQIAGLLVRLESTGSPPAWPSEEYAFTVLGNVRIRFEQWRTALSGAPLLYAYYEWDWDNLIGPLDLS